jgi:hypothetical protein
VTRRDPHPLHPAEITPAPEPYQVDELSERVHERDGRRVHGPAPPTTATTRGHLRWKWGYPVDGLSAPQIFSPICCLAEARMTPTSRRSATWPGAFADERATPGAAAAVLIASFRCGWPSPPSTRWQTTSAAGQGWTESRALDGKAQASPSALLLAGTAQRRSGPLVQGDGSLLAYEVRLPSHGHKHRR